MIDELAHAGPEHLDPAFVAGYDRKQGHPDPAEDLAIFEAHGLRGASAVVDLGAGSGQFALAAARRFRFRVTCLSAIAMGSVGLTGPAGRARGRVGQRPGRVGIRDPRRPQPPRPQHKGWLGHARWPEVSREYSSR